MKELTQWTREGSLWEDPLQESTRGTRWRPGLEVSWVQWVVHWAHREHCSLDCHFLLAGSR